jgi:hypothetical protein
MFRVCFRRHLLLAILLTATALVFAVCAIRLSGMAADDSFIHRRIALNYQHLGKPYFNPDQRVMVTSSPLWILLLAVAGAVLPVANPVPWLELSFVLLGAASAYLLMREELDSEGLPSLLFPALAFLYVCVGAWPSSMDQMEAPCAIALILTGSLGILTRKNWGMPLLVLACFARYECVLLCVLASIWVTVHRKWTKLSLLSCAGIGLLGAAWLLREYGTVIPNTVVAKSHLYITTYQHVVRVFISSKTRATFCLALGIFWWLYGKDRRRMHDPAAVLLAGFGVSLGVAYVAHKTFIFSWYLPLVLVPPSIAILLWTNRKDLGRAALGAAFAGLLLGSSVAWDVRLLLAALHRTPDNIAGFSVAARVHEYQRIGAALYGVCPSGVLLTSEIGGLGWEFHGKILDGTGLASPEAIHYHPMRVPEERSNGSLGEIPAGYVRDQHPDLIVSYDILAESALPAARSLGYIDYSEPLFVREDRAGSNSLWDARQMHVLVAPDQRCSATAIERAVRVALER